MSFNGTDYAVSGQLFRQFEAGYEQARKEAADANGGKEDLARDARHRPDQVAHEPAQRGRGEGGRRRHDQDHGRRRRGEAARRRQHGPGQRPPRAGDAGVGQEVPKELSAQQREEITDAVKGAPGRDLHGPGGQDPAPDGRRGRRRGRPRGPPTTSPPPPSGSTSRSPTSTRTRTSRRPRTPSRSTTCSEQFGGLGGLGAGLGGAGGDGRRAARAPARAAQAPARHQRQPREVLQVRDRRRQRRRQGAQVRRAPHQPVGGR